MSLIGCWVGSTVLAGNESPAHIQPEYTRMLCANILKNYRSGIRRTALPSFLTCTRSFSSSFESAHRSGGVFFPVAQ